MDAHNDMVSGKNIYTEDPLWDEIFVNDNVNLVENAKHKHILSSAEGLFSLSASVYATLSMVDKKFGLEVSHSMFDYYVVMLYWARMLVIQQRNGYHCIDDELSLKEFLYFIESANCDVPYPIAMHLNGIGNFKNPNGIFFMHGRIPPKCWDALEGKHFGYLGKVEASSHNYYTIFPAPGVVMDRIRADILLTKNIGMNEWDIPEELRPDGGLKPTRNLLGWTLAKKLTNNQLLTIEECFVKPTGHLDIAPFCLNKRLFQRIANLVNIRKDVFLMKKINMENPQGSICQMMLIERTIMNDFVENRHNLYCEGTLRVASGAHLNRRLVVAAAIMAYRVKKLDLQGHSAWSCYSGDDKFKSVPSDWCAKINSFIDITGNENNATVYTGILSKKLLQNELMDRCIIHKGVDEQLFAPN